MNSTDVQTFKYLDNTTAPVSLVEYYIQEIDDKKYIGFKFVNNLNQELKKLVVSVDVLATDGALLERTDFEIITSVKAYDEFISQYRLEVVRDACQIKINIVRAVFTNSEYVNGALIAINKEVSKKTISENIIKKEDLTKAEKKYNKDVVKSNKKALKQNTKAIKKLAKEKKDSKFKVVSLNNVKTKFIWKILIFVIFVACCVGIVYSEIYFKSVIGTIKTIDNVTYQITTSEAYVYDSDKSIDSLDLPASITYKEKDYYVTKVCDNAFKDSNIQTITFNHSISIGVDAFKNSSLITIYNSNYITSVSVGSFENTKLTTVTLENVRTVYENTFANNEKLTSVNIPNALINNNAFKGCLKISSIDVRATSSKKFSDIFGDSKDRILISVYVRSNLDDEYTFLNITISNLYIKKGSTYSKEGFIRNLYATL